MTKKPVKDETVPTGKNGVLFINFDLDKEARVGLKKWTESFGSQAFEFLDNLLEKGYTLSLKRDTYNDCMGAFLACKDEKNENNGFILTSRSSTSWGALLGVLYRHFSVFDEVWPTYNKKRGVLDDDE